MTADERTILSRLLASLASAVSILEEAEARHVNPSMAMPSNKLFMQALADYRAAMHGARMLLWEKKT